MPLAGQLDFWPSGIAARVRPALGEEVALLYHRLKEKRCSIPGSEGTKLPVCMDPAMLK